MFRSKVLRPLVVGAGVVALQLLSASSAFAYFVTIQAEAVCISGIATINYTAGSWDSGVNGSNTNVDILFGSSVVDPHFFSTSQTPPNSFSGSQPAPAGATSVVVTVSAYGTWGTGDPNSDRTASTTVTIPQDCVEITAFGRFTGGPNADRVVDVGGARLTGDPSVTTGLQLHCHLDNHSDNLEVNWAGGRWHLEEVTAVSCSNDPLLSPEPPKAPVDTMRATATGRYNGVSGYTAVYTLKDSGEPDNKRTDRIAITIFETANPSNVVLTVLEQNITGGNIQAHFDQPHGPNK
jgi:hypothetical protein